MYPSKTGNSHYDDTCTHTFTGSPGRKSRRPLSGSHLNDQWGWSSRVPRPRGAETVVKDEGHKELGAVG